MKTSIGKLLVASLITLAVTAFALAPMAEAAGRGGRGGGGGGGGGARAGGGGARGGGGQARGGGQAGQRAQVNNTRADARTNNVRNGSVNNVNNVNVNRNVNVEGNSGCCGGGWDNDYHPVAAAAAVTGAVAVTSAVVGSMVRTPPANCAPVNYGGMVYQQCGSTWYQPQGGQYVVVNPPY